METQGDAARRGFDIVVGAIDAVESGGEAALHQYGAELLTAEPDHEKIAGDIRAAIEVAQTISLFLASTLLVKKLNERRQADASEADGATRQNQPVS